MSLARGGTAAGLALAFALFTASAADAACPAGDGPFPALYPDAALFDAPIAGEAATEPFEERLSGITVPHHLLAADLVARGFQAASAGRYERVVLLSPDHFRGAERPFATTRRGFDTPFGTVETDRAAVEALLASQDIVEESCLFHREHGVHSLTPFVRHHFPDAAIVPVAISIRAKREDWDRMTEALRPLVGDGTLVIQSTDFSHYMPRHRARLFDQQTLNVIASGSLDALVALREPDHVDSLGALYIQMRLQREAFGAGPAALAHANSQAYGAIETDETTSYVVLAFGAFPPELNDPVADDVKIYLFAGDTYFGRAMQHVLLRDGATERVRAAILARTKGRPLIVNLEGVILPNVPAGLGELTLAMPEELAIDWLEALDVAAVGLANNHALDLGPAGLAETRRALDAAGIRSFGQGEAVALPGLDVVGLTDIDSTGPRNVDLLTPDLLDLLARPDAARPVVAFVHWGREYAAQPSERERTLADAMRLRSVAGIIGAHPHVADGAIEALAGGDAFHAYSLGNFLFDQGGARASGALLELRVFAEGTVFPRLVPLPNFFDMARE